MADNYPSDWNSRRKSVYQRDGYKCQNCGRLGGTQGNAELHAHHIVPINKGGSHSKTNLKTMCSQCHNAIHNDSQAPTATGSIQSKERLTGFQDVWEFYSKYFGELKEASTGHMISYRDDVGLRNVIGLYEQDGTRYRKISHKIKRNLSSFDSYDNADSDHVGDDFKQIFSELLDISNKAIDECLELDRQLQKYVQELTEVECHNCGKIYDESKKFCGECGESLPLISKCGECGRTRDDVNQNFCNNCGSELYDYPEDRLDQIEITVSNLGDQKQVVDDSLENTSTFISEKARPKWEQELSNI
jgi:rRNA maturation endonuclease Nob1